MNSDDDLRVGGRCVKYKEAWQKENGIGYKVEGGRWKAETHGTRRIYLISIAARRLEDKKSRR
jgi:hypothetical protein